MNAAFALLSAVDTDEDPAEIERVADAALGDVSAIATEALIRIGTSTANACAIRLLAGRCGDETLIGRVKSVLTVGGRLGRTCMTQRMELAGGRHFAASGAGAARPCDFDGDAKRMAPCGRGATTRWTAPR